jgi:hypothetical protein
LRQLSDRRQARAVPRMGTPYDYGYGPFSLNPDTPRADITAAGEFEGSALNTQRPPAILFRLVALCFLGAARPRRGVWRPWEHPMEPPTR